MEIDNIGAVIITLFASIALVIILSCCGDEVVEKKEALICSSPLILTCIVLMIRGYGHILFGW